jgi:plastocyanin
MRRLLILAAVPVLSAAVAIPALAATRSVKIGDNYFVRSSGVPTITVKKGDSVRWKFEGKRQHNVTVKSGPVMFHSSTKSSGTFTKKLTRTGTYTIYCTLHGQGDQSMKVKVTK